MDRAIEFWKRVDELRGNISLSDLSEAISVPYSTIRNQRTENRYPKRSEIEAIASFLGVSFDFLDRGFEQINITPEMYYVRRNKRAEWIMHRCMESEKMLAVLYAFVECLSKEELLES